MSGSHGYVQLPPDGVGKKVPQSVMQDINFNGGTIAFVVGDTVTFSTSTWTGTVIEVDGSTAVGNIHVRVESPVPNTITLVAGENIIVNAVTKATVADLEGNLYYFQQNQLVGHDVTNIADINEFGALKTTFPDGAPTFDAFGKMRSSTQHKLAEYIHSYDELPNDYTTEIVGGATLAYENNTRGVLLQCGTASGDRITRTSDEYHIYQAGVSQLLEFTGAIGDTGKTNVTRRAGYYDDDNGLFFELADSVFNVVLRSKSTGSIVETRIPSTDWNIDKMTGAGGEFNPSGLQANPSKDNIYWLDLQWLGSGRIRFGMDVNGRKITVHEIRHANTLTQSYMSTGSLPFRYEQINTGTAGSISQFRIFCASVKTEGAFNPFVRAFSDNNTVNVATTTDTPLLGWRSAQTYNGYNNRSTGYPESFTIHNSGTDAIMFSMYRGATADGAATWTSHGGESTMEVTKDLISTTGGSVRFSDLIGGGETKTIPFPALNNNRRGIRRKADITQWTELTLTAKLLAAGTGGNVTIVFNWGEVRD